MKTIMIGIDPGTHTGIATWNQTEHKLEMVETMTITQALDYVAHERMRAALYNNEEIIIYFEDARKRNWFGFSGREKLQGAGSVKRDCAIWETFCEEHGIECRKIAPKNNTTKLSAAQFRILTHWGGRTSEHSRDAAMLVYGR